MPEALLEFKAKDGAWYAGTASFEGPFLRVHFEHFSDEDDEKWLPTRFKSLKDVKKVVRPTSQPMQDLQCSSLRPGIFLCVACRQPGTDCFEYFDAKLEEIRRSPHNYGQDGQECCVCKFEVEWLGGPLVHERSFVTCGDICLRIYGDIEDFPVIKDFLAEVNFARILKSKAVAKRDNKSASKKRKATPVDDGKSEQGSSADFMQASSTSEHIGSGISLHWDETNGLGDHGLKTEENVEAQPFTKILFSRQRSKSGKPPIVGPNLSDLNQTAKDSVDVIEIDLDKEEDCKPLSTASHNQTSARNDVVAEQLELGFNCSEHDHRGMSQKASSSVGDPFFTQEDSSRIEKERMFSCTGDAPACSYASLSRPGQEGEPCHYRPLGFIPIAPFCLKNTCAHTVFMLKDINASAKRSGNTCNHSATSHICSQDTRVDGQPLHMNGCEVNYDIKENTSSLRSRTEEQVYELEKDLDRTPFLLIENMEKDIIPSEAMIMIRKVTCDALMLYVWPSLDYETTRKGYLCYQDFEAAKAAFQKLSADNLFIVSSKARPWVVSQASLHKLDWSQMLSFGPAFALAEEDIEDGKEAKDAYFRIVHRGTEEYTIARGKHKLFLEQQKKLHLCFQQFRVEEEELQMLT